MMMASRFVLRPARRVFSDKAQDVERKNYLLAGTLFLFTGGVYYYVMSKIKASDDLAELESEGKVNLHESGLKVTKPRSVHDALVPKKEA